MAARITFTADIVSQNGISHVPITQRKREVQGGSNMTGTDCV
jgi:hypothetical protein